MDKIELPQDTFDKVVKIIWSSHNLMSQYKLDLNDTEERSVLKNHIMNFIPETTAMYIIDTLGFKKKE